MSKMSPVVYDGITFHPFEKYGCYYGAFDGCLYWTGMNPDGTADFAGDTESCGAVEFFITEQQQDEITEKFGENFDLKIEADVFDDFSL